MTRGRREPDDGPSCTGCKHWHEQTAASDEVRWGNCHAGPPSVVGEGEGGAICVTAWSELPYVCGAHTPRTH